MSVDLSRMCLCCLGDSAALQLRDVSGETALSLSPPNFVQSPHFCWVVLSELAPGQASTIQSLAVQLATACMLKPYNA